MRRIGLLTVAALTVLAPLIATAQSKDRGPKQYRVLATTRTSTLEKELNEAAAAGFRFYSVMGGETVIGGKEVVTVVGRAEGDTPRYQYKLLATNRTSTMQRELQQAADAGFHYIGQTVFESLLGGREVVAILERDSENTARTKYEYRLFATTRTSTMERELTIAGAEGFEVLGMTVGKTAVGGNEVVAITRRQIQ
jgi:hypothetical protein